MFGLMSPPKRDQATLADDVQVAVTRQRLTDVGELDPHEAFALDADVGRLIGAGQVALLERTTALDGAGTGAHCASLEMVGRPPCSYSRSEDPTRRRL